MDNLAFWNEVERTDPAVTKKVTYGQRSFTTIDAYYQIKNATAIFGSFGLGWGVKDEIFTFHDDLLFYQAAFFYTLEETIHEFPIASSILWQSFNDKLKKLKKDEDCAKKVRTDALTKGLSYLGFNADVFLGKFNDNRYLKQMKKEHGSKPENPKPESSAKEIYNLLLHKGMNPFKAREFCEKAVGRKPSAQWSSSDIKKIKENLEFWGKQMVLKKEKERSQESWGREKKRASA